MQNDANLAAETAAAVRLSPRRKTTEATTTAELAQEQLAHFHLDTVVLCPALTSHGELDPMRSGPPARRRSTALRSVGHVYPMTRRLRDSLVANGSCRSRLQLRQEQQ